jgi:hypothetical protein
LLLLSLASSVAFSHQLEVINVQYLLDIEAFLAKSHREAVEDHFKDVLLAFILRFLPFLADVNREPVEQSTLVIVDFFLYF